LHLVRCEGIFARDIALFKEGAHARLDAALHPGQGQPAMHPMARNWKLASEMDHGLATISTNAARAAELSNSLRR